MAMPTKYNISGFIKGSKDFGLPFSNRIFNATLNAATDTSLTVPLDTGLGEINSQKQPKYIALFTYAPGVKFYIALNAAASAPAGAGFAAATSVINPPWKLVQAGDVIHAKSTAGGDISVEFFYISEA